jgi:hypothetical protein
MHELVTIREIAARRAVRRGWQQAVRLVHDRGRRRCQHEIRLSVATLAVILARPVSAFIAEPRLASLVMVVSVMFTCKGAVAGELLGRRRPAPALEEASS